MSPQETEISLLLKTAGVHIIHASRLLYLQDATTAVTLVKKKGGVTKRKKEETFVIQGWILLNVYRGIGSNAICSLFIMQAIAIIFLWMGNSDDTLFFRCTDKRKLFNFDTNEVCLKALCKKLFYSFFF